jgi:hypothetical protein
VGAVLGLLLGGLAGRLSAPSVQDQVRAVRSDAQQTTAGLRVIALHDSVGTGSGGTDLVLKRTRTELEDELSRAPWVSSSTGSALLAQLSALDDRSDEGSAEFGAAAEALATRIDSAFSR